MGSQLLVLNLPLLLLVGWAAVIDVRSRRIPNWLTLTAVITGLAQAYFIDGGLTLGGSVKGLLAGFGLPFVLFAFRILGAGDVKLLAGIGAWIGAWPVVVVILAAAALGGVLGLLQGMWQGRLPALLRNTFLLAANLMNVKRLGVPQGPAGGQGTKTARDTLPYAVPILIATALVLVAGPALA